MGGWPGMLWIRPCCCRQMRARSPQNGMAGQGVEGGERLPVRGGYSKNVGGVSFHFPT